MPGGGIHVRFDAGDLFLQRFASRLQFVDRQRVEILFPKLGEGILRLVGKKIVEVHDA